MPGTKVFTADNVTGASITPTTDCCKIIIYEQQLAGTDAITYNLNGGGFVVRDAGCTIEIQNIFTVLFKAGISIGTIKRLNAGTLTLNQEEL